MKRRTVILGLGSIVASSGAVIGSGAFSSTAAGRTVTVSLSDDRGAFLGLDELGEGGRSRVDGDTIDLYFPSLSETSPRTGGNPDLGLGPDSVYEFDRDVNEGPDGVEGLIRITNQSATPVRVYSEADLDSELEIELYRASGPDRTGLRDNPPELMVGSSLDVGVRIKTFGVTPGNFDETLTIVAERPNE